MFTITIYHDVDNYNPCLYVIHDDVYNYNQSQYS